MERGFTAAAELEKKQLPLFAIVLCNHHKLKIYQAKKVKDVVRYKGQEEEKRVAK